jgi:predicted RNA-binding protein with PIN domain
VRLIVDGMNVIGSRPNRWWRDRERAMRRLVGALDAYAQATGDETAVVLDARPFDLGDEVTAVTVHFAPGGRDAGDDEIVRIVERDAAPDTLTIVSSDKELAARVGTRGARVISSGEFRTELDRFEAG